MNKSLSAFTLMEVTIAMLVSAVVVSMTYTVYQMVGRSYRDYSSRQDRVAELMLADQLMRSDFLAAHKITRTEKGLELTLDQGLLSYTFSQDLILRDQFSLHTDTLKIPVQEAGYSFEGREQLPGENIDQLELLLELDGRVLPRLYKKKYSSNDLFK